MKNEKWDWDVTCSLFLVIGFAVASWVALGWIVRGLLQHFEVI